MMWKRSEAAPAHPIAAFGSASHVTVDAGDGWVWRGVQERTDFAKASSSGARRYVYLLRALLEPWEVDRVLEVARSQSLVYNDDPDSVDGRPTFETYLMTGSRYTCDDYLREVLEPLVEGRLAPYIRQRYKCPDAVICTCLLRRYLPGERRLHPPHYDMHAFCTTVVGLNVGEFEGGLFVQSAPDAASRVFIPIGRGDAVFHQFDLEHGAEVLSGTRYSLIFWAKDSMHACLTNGVPWYHDCANAGDADAQYLLAGLYYSGYGTIGESRNEESAVYWYKRAAEQGQAEAMLNLGSMYDEAHGSLEDDPALAVRWWREAAERGSCAAQQNLASALLRGRGIVQDEAGALWWMEQAAAQGDPEAVYKLSAFLSSSESEVQDPNRAWELQGKAAEAGHPIAAYLHGCAYLDRGDLVQARPWLVQSANGGDGRAMRVLGELATDDGDLEAAVAWFRRAADMGDRDGQWRLSCCLRLGEGGSTRDLGKAFDWCLKAAEQGCKEAEAALEDLREEAGPAAGPLPPCRWSAVSCGNIKRISMRNGLGELLPALGDPLLQPLILGGVAPKMQGEVVLGFMRALAELAGQEVAIVEDGSPRSRRTRELTVSELVAEVHHDLVHEAYRAVSSRALAVPGMGQCCHLPCELIDDPSHLELIIGGRQGTCPLRQAEKATAPSGSTWSWWWSFLALGHVRWFLYPPGPPPDRDSDRWVAMQGMGDLLLVPEGWWHEATHTEKTLALAPALLDLSNFTTPPMACAAAAPNEGACFFELVD